MNIYFFVNVYSTQARVDTQYPFPFKLDSKMIILGVTVKFYHCLLYTKSTNRRELAYNLVNRLYDHGARVSLFAEFTQSFQEQSDADRTGTYC
jgi:hypothetical protein